MANASHQLRTPLTGLRLRLEAAALKSRDPEVERELSAAEHETERLARLLSELLTLAAEASARPRSSSTWPRRWRPRAGAGRARREHLDHELRVEPGEPSAVSASGEDLAAILDNLTENALHYSPAGSTVTITWAADGQGVRLAVLDEGPGHRPGRERARVPALLPRLGQPRRAAGTGLGLAVVESLAARWGGEVTLGNQPGGGARAEVALPARRFAKS